MSLKKRGINKTDFFLFAMDSLLGGGFNPTWKISVPLVGVKIQNHPVLFPFVFAKFITKHDCTLWTLEIKLRHSTKELMLGQKS